MRYMLLPLLGGCAAQMTALKDPARSGSVPYVRFEASGLALDGIYFAQPGEAPRTSRRWVPPELAPPADEPAPARLPAEVERWVRASATDEPPPWLVQQAASGRREWVEALRLWLTLQIQEVRR